MGTACPTLMGFTVSPLGSIGDLLPHICGVPYGLIGVTWGPSAPHLWGLLWVDGGLLEMFCPTSVGFHMGSRGSPGDLLPHT